MATFTVNNSAGLSSAAFSAVSGDVINVTANITATVLATILTFAAGVEINYGGFTVSGFVWIWDGGTSGHYNPTIVRNGTIDVTGAFHSGQLGSLNPKRGAYFFTDLTVSGLSGGGVANGKTFACLDSSTARCEVTMTRVNVLNSSSDCVSSGCISGTSMPTSWLKLFDCDLSSPGANVSDNCLTSHNNFAVYMFDGSLANPGGGPIVNSAPVNSTMELYRVAIAVSGTTEIHVTKIVGCTVTGTSSGDVVLHGDSLKSSEPSVCHQNTLSVGVTIRHDDIVLPPAFYRNTFTTDEKGIKYSSACNVTSTMARNTFNGPKLLNGSAMRPRGNGTSFLFNNTINVPVAPSANVYTIWADTPISGTNTVEVRRQLINQAGRSISWATRGDAANSQILIYESVTTCNTAIFFDGNAPHSSSTNSTINGTNPNAYEVGAAFICNELKVLPAYGLEGWSDAVTPLDDIGKYYGLFPPSLQSVTVNSSSQITVSYTNLNGSARDHRIERATNSGFTTGLTTFDVVGVPSGSATYVDTTCAGSTQYFYRVRAKNTAALSIVSGSASGTTPSSVDSTPPTVATAVIDSSGAILTITYNESDSPPVLPVTAVTGFTLSSSVGMVVVLSNGTRVSPLVHTFALSRPVYSFETITLDYSSGNVTDSAAAPNSLAAIVGRAVTNNSIKLPVLLQAWELLEQAAADAGWEMTVTP